ncbi:oligosaccharide flippase family protein [Mycobacterium sp. C3-094]|uniref:oligosaccharide flippase family protein n=1 Tax=Mycobacterium sp. PSTR-4-N TaxID=2917745 RepID=UPI001F14AA2E|nr:oligosaccharide flippase family protein [Mycobacterium sp. PSTR-4-N]MCG7595440.1 oligosaccharide flippase family protein [Mycobacterium sp. PSTR-4-N]
MTGTSGADVDTPDLSGPGSMAGTLRRGAAISTAMLVFTQLVSLVQTLVLARLLSPEEVGWFAAGTVLSSFLITFAEGGLANALVQREGRLHDATVTVFWATLSTGLAWALVAVACAPLIGRLFGSAIVGSICAVSAGSIVLHALTYVPDALLQRRFDFRARYIVQPVIVVTFAVTSVTLCANGFGVWGLVIGSYCSVAAWLVATWTLAGFRSVARGRPSLAVWRELTAFSLPLVTWTIVNRARDMIETAIVGGALNPTALGFYRYGRRLGALPEVAVIDVASYVLFPAFSRLAGDPARLRSAFRRALQVLWCLTLPVACLIIAIGEPAVVVLLGEKWRGAGVMLVALAGIGPGVAMMAVGMESIKGVGRTAPLHWVTIVSTALGLGLLFALLPLGLAGVGLALSLSTLAAGFLSLLLARRPVGLTIGELVRLLGPPVLVAAAPAVGVGLIEHLLIHVDERTVFVAAPLLALEAAGYLALCAVGLSWFVPSAWHEISTVARQMRNRSA